MIYNRLRPLLALIFFLLPPAFPAAAEPVWLFDGQRAVYATVAKDPASRAKGLMYRPWLLPHSGMLFVFDPPADISFWMKNTFLPLDIRFYDPFGRVLAHYPFALPCLKTPCPLYPAHGNAAFVLETRGQFRVIPQAAPPLRVLLEN